MSPRDFWALHPAELLWLMDTWKPKKTYGSMTEDEVRQIYEETWGKDGLG